MPLKEKLILWFLKQKRKTFLRMKKMDSLDIAEDDAFWKLHISLLEEQRGVQTIRERYNLWRIVQATATIKGALAEVGVYRGGSAKVICEAKGTDELHLFDTFEGMPAVRHETDGGFSTGDFKETSLKEVSDYLSSYPNVHLHKGRFPDSLEGKGLHAKKFRFVHLDVDIFESTLACLDFFYPRMQQGGIIISHDYRNLTVPGVRAAYEKFFYGKPEPVLPLWDTQCVVTKILPLE